VDDELTLNQLELVRGGMRLSTFEVWRMEVLNEDWRHCQYSGDGIPRITGKIFDKWRPDEMGGGRYDNRHCWILMRSGSDSCG